MGASRLHVSYDIQYEVENFDLLMDEATPSCKKREKSGSKVSDVPMESWAEKALKAMCISCPGRKDIAEEDAPLFSTILKVVFPIADKEQLDSIVTSYIFDPFSSNTSKSDEIQDFDVAGKETSGRSSVRSQPQSQRHLGAALRASPRCDSISPSSWRI